ncbi:MAG: DUF1295 domain-containing protein, partial [Chloroflexota bacterium]
MLEFWTIFAAGYGILILIGTLLWLVSLYLNNASIVDQFWSLLFLAVGGFYFFRTGQESLGNSTRQAIVMGLLTVWSLRLSIYLFWRNWGEPEDYRYKRFRQTYGPERYWWVSLFQVFWLQGTLAWIMSSTLLGGLIGSDGLNLFDYIGVLVWLIGFAFEA